MEPNTLKVYRFLGSDEVRPTITIGNDFYLKSEVDKVVAEKESDFKDALVKIEGQESLIKEMKEAAANIGLKWQDYDAGEDAWEDQHRGKWIKIGEPMIDLHDWNDVSNTKIPLNEEIFALLEVRMDPEKLRPAVIVARMIPAKRLTWTENKEGDVLCYDVPAGNFHSCNGDDIKYWKYVNVPSKQAEVEPNPPPKPVAFFDHSNEPDCTTEYLVYDKQEADAYIQWLEQKVGVL